jgi:peptidyl-tRNA hydrolase, PTH1 family
MKLIVGLGNPGRKYVGTRHNVGWEVLAKLADRFGVSRTQAKFQGEVVEAAIGGHKALLLAPQTYMNCSGSSVRAARDFYKIENSDLIVVCDDLNLPVAKLRFRARGSSGGQRGMEDVIRQLGTEEFARLRMGIGSPPPNWNTVDYVLGRFSAEERTSIDAAVSAAVTALADWAGQGVEFCMNRYNAN